MDDTASVISNTETLVEPPPDFSINVASWEVRHPDGVGYTGHPGFAEYIYHEIVCNLEITHPLVTPQWAVRASEKSKSKCRRENPAKFENRGHNYKEFNEVFGDHDRERHWMTQDCKYVLRCGLFVELIWTQCCLA